MEGVILNDIDKLISVLNNNYKQNGDDINQIKAAFITNKVPYNWLVKSKKFVNTNLNLMVYLKTLNAEREYLNDLVTECIKLC